MDGSCDYKGVKRKDVMEGPSDNTQLPLKMPRSDVDTNEGLKSLPNPGKFISLKKIFKILRDDNETILESVPPGEKNNVYFVLEDSENALRRDARSAVKYIDDYEGWRKNRNCRTTYVQFIGGRITQLEHLRNMFCVVDRTGRGVVKTPLNPQPDPKTLIRVSRYLCRRGDGLNRRITAVSGIGFMDRSLVEYCTRIQTPSVPGGPVRKAFKNSTPEEDDESESASSQESDEDDRNDSIASDNDEMSYNERSAREDFNDDATLDIVKVEMDASPQVHCEDLAMIAMLEENPSVQAVIHKKNELPSVILYDHKQLSDLKRNLECGSVMGIDCSYKIGDCHATMIVFQNSMALHKETNEPLMSLGPIYLHWDEEFLTYASFFSHLVDRLEGLKPNVEVKLGEEMDMFVFDALKHSFPTSLKLVNSYHLKDLVDGDLRYIMPGKLKPRGEILQKLFGFKGIISSLSLSVFEERMAELELFFHEFPSLEAYFDKLKPIMYRYICEPQQRGMSPELWMNGNDEVLNSLLHSCIQHRVHKLPSIVDNLCKITKLESQYLEKLTGMRMQEIKLEMD